jgi:hypothetical protein
LALAELGREASVLNARARVSSGAKVIGPAPGFGQKILGHPFLNDCCALLPMVHRLAMLAFALDQTGTVQLMEYTRPGRLRMAAVGHMSRADRRSDLGKLGVSAHAIWTLINIIECDWPSWIEFRGA